MPSMLMFSRIYDMHTSYNTSRNELEKSMARIASGDKFVKLGSGLGGNLAMSERFRYRIASAKQSTQALEHARTYVDQADFMASTVMSITQRMSELAAVSVNQTITDNERGATNAEFQALKDEISQITRTSKMFDQQTVGRDAIVSFDDRTSNPTTGNEVKQIHFWNALGGDEGKITRDFDSNAKDSHNNFIGFNVANDFTMSRDGRSLYYLGTTDSAGATVALKRYDIKNDVVQTSTDTYAATDKLFVDEEGSVFINGAGTLYGLNQSTLDRQSTATGITNMSTGLEFSVYKDQVTYHTTANEIVRYDLNTSTQTAVAVANPAGVVTPPPAAAANNFGLAGVDHAFSASGRYAADEISDGVLRVIDTVTGTGTTLTITGGTGTADAVKNFAFDEDSRKIYYVDTTRNEIRYLNVNTDNSNNVNLSVGSTVVEGKRDITLNGLNMGGSNFGSIVPFALSEDSVSDIEYEAADLRLYNLGLLESSVDTLANANTALVDMQTAISRISQQRAKLGAYGSRFEHVLDSHQSYIQSVMEGEAAIRNVDIAEESTTLAQLTMSQQASASMITQFNSSLQSILMLLNG
ncbi:MAG: flagellin [Chlamydiales bacterium]|jgi:flagellin